MKNYFFNYFVFVFMGFCSLEALTTDSFFNPGMQQEEPKIFVNNRILARVNGKPISTYGLMKKMDLSFYRQYPEYVSSTAARAQYYDMSWKYVLEDMIDKELILADAQESKIEVTAGDVRQEMEKTFGPNIIANLDQAGFSFDEAFKIMQDEIIIGRMVAGRAHAKALRQVTPSKIKQAYEEFIKDPANARLTQWTYRFVTIKDRTLEKTEETAKKCFDLLMQGVPFDQLVAKVKEQKLVGRKGKVTVSKVIKQNDKEISPDYRDILTSLDSGMYSQPFVNKSRVNRTTVYRILFIEEKIPGGVPSFKEMETNLKNKLLDQAIDQETEIYLKKLRQYYHVQWQDIEAFIPTDYQPYTLQ